MWQGYYSGASQWFDLQLQRPAVFRRRLSLTGGFSLDFGNQRACSFLFPTISGIFTPD